MGPKAVAQAFEIADGWLPIFLSPEKARDAFGDAIANAREGFDIAATAPVDPHRRRRGGPRVPEAVLRALHRRHGRARARTSTTTSSAATATRTRRARSRTSTSTGKQARRGGGGAGRVRRRGRARRAEGAARGAARRVARVGRDVAPRLDAAARGAASARRARLVAAEPRSASADLGSRRSLKASASQPHRSGPLPR